MSGCPATGVVVGTKSPHCGYGISSVGEIFPFPVGAEAREGVGVGTVISLSRLGKPNKFAGGSMLAAATEKDDDPASALPPQNALGEMPESA